MFPSPFEINNSFNPLSENLIAVDSLIHKHSTSESKELDRGSATS